MTAESRRGELEQFQRQVLAIKRASTATTSSTGTTSLSLGSIDEDLHDRIRFACLLQEEIASQLGKIPINSSNSLLKRKVCKDFQVISTQLETSVRRVAAREQEQQRTLIEQQQHQHQQQQEQAQNGHLIAEHQGQVFQFAELENEIAHNEALIEEREQDIHTIHQSVAQVNEIFRDLAAIVHDQQSAIDDIETHVHESMEQTRQGLNQVKKASEMQTSCMIQ
ncbi:unnamed protein product [Peronospora belbahrii]|uniref:t-SNARE coiled-coil homology domain-containing protein n=1 Tax=Peronospora belbahrii TaxID=622444 RepID=A0AAU9KPF8_9STRA|nr:unnamed protein product [Peronospora belbahrii]